MRIQKVVTFSNFLIASVLLLLAFNNCSPIDFEKGPTGDLTKLNSGNTHVGNPLTSSAKTLLNAICHVTSRCHQGLSVSECEVGVSAISGIDFQLGLDRGLFPLFSDIIAAENTGTLSANSTASETCIGAVEKLTCDDPAVQNAYNPQSATPFSGVAFLIPTSPGSCPAVFHQPPARNEFYVATFGSDSNDGSKEKPWASLVHASNALTLGAEGAIVHVAPGTYSFPATNSCPVGQRPCSIYTTRNGTASAPITYISDQQGAAKLAPTGATTIWFNKGNHVKIVGFEMVGTSETSWGIYQDGSNSQIISNHIHNIPNSMGCAEGRAGGGIIFGYYSDSHDNDAIGNLIHDLGPNVENGLSETAYCRATAGIDYQQPGGKVYNNIIYRSGAFGIRTYHNARNLQISNNLIFSTGYRSSSGTFVGAAIHIAGEPGIGVMSNSTVSNNILRDNNAYGLAEDGQVGSNNVYTHNLMYQNGSNLNLHSGLPALNTITTDPLMVNFQINGSGNYRLQSGSPARDSGSAVSASDDFSGFKRPYGQAADLGPFEWHP